jgi:hypothetical protein
MKWEFTPTPPAQVETEITQRDQFNNEDVDLSETVVREAVQNSLDAALNENGSVKVVFKWLTKSTGIDVKFFRQLFNKQIDHAKFADLDIASLDFENPTALVIEDFGTSGLTGSVSSKTDEHFSDFWRRHGKSHKTGASRGRWGLGKLVYSATSEIGAFFGVTNRLGEKEIHLMGQTVLNLRKVDGYDYPPHAFFADYEGTDVLTRIPVPIQDEHIINSFCTNFKIDRSEKPGLSVIVPFPDSKISKDKMISVAIANYFYPIVTGKLTFRFDDQMIDAENVRELAKKYANDRFNQIDILFDFIEEIREAEKGSLLTLKPTWIEDKKLDEDDFEPEDLEKIRTKFEEGSLVGLELPVTVKEKRGDRTSKFSIYIKRPNDLDKGVDMYVRGGLTLPQEAKFEGRRALGAMIAEDEPVCAFLGDAENAAHTKWSNNTEKLKRNYRNNQHTATLISVIRRSLKELHDLLAEVTEEKDEDALLDFFWINEPEETKKKRSTKKKKPKPVKPIIPKAIPLFDINSRKAGFAVKGSQTLTEEKLPREIKIKVAYDVTSGNPFKNYSPHDFSVGRGGTIKSVLSRGTKEISVKENEWLLEITALPFEIIATGFDENRDLSISVK